MYPDTPFLCLRHYGKQTPLCALFALCSNLGSLDFLLLTTPYITNVFHVLPLLALVSCQKGTFGPLVQNSHNVFFFRSLWTGSTVRVHTHPPPPQFKHANYYFFLFVFHLCDSHLTCNTFSLVGVFITVYHVMSALPLRSRETNFFWNSRKKLVSGKTNKKQTPNYNFT